MIKVEGLNNRWSRHIKMAELTQNWAFSHGQELFPEKNYESYTLTCIKNIKDWDINKINEILLQKGFRMDRGYGYLRGKVFRIPHMGNIYMEDLKEYLNVFDEVLCQLKY
jgi:aspartate aminotransferase-like enzyme